MRLGILATHPIQYQAPLFRALANTSGIELEVLFCHDHGLKADFDPGFGQHVKFDVPLLEGYRYRFLRNVAPRPGLRFSGIVNPEIRRVVAENTFDVLIVQGYTTATPLMAMLKRRSRTGTRILFRGESHLNERRSLPKRVGKQVLLRPLFRRVDHFLPIGSLNRDYFRAYGVPEERMTLAPYSVDNDFFANGARASRDNVGEARRRFGLPPDRPVFLYCAKLSEVKRPLDAVRGFAIARREHPCALAFVGAGELEQPIRAEIDKLGIAEDVHLLGFRNQSELPSLYGVADALVLPSGTEPWGLVVNEAMAAGAAILVSDRVGSAVDLVRDNGAVFPVGDVEKLGAIMAHWAGNPELLAAMGKASRRIIDTWGIRDTAQAFIAGAERALALRPCTSGTSMSMR